MAQNSTKYKKIAIQSSNHWLEYIHLFNDIFSNHFTPYEIVLQEQIANLSDEFNVIASEHHLPYQIAPLIIDEDDPAVISCVGGKFPESKPIYDNFDWDCGHIEGYHKQLRELFLSL